MNSRYFLIRGDGDSHDGTSKGDSRDRSDGNDKKMKIEFLHPAGIPFLVTPKILGGESFEIIDDHGSVLRVSENEIPNF